MRPDARRGGPRIDLVDAEDDGHEDLLGFGHAVGAQACERLALAGQAHGVPAVRVDQDGGVPVDDGIEGHGGGADAETHGGLAGAAVQVGEVGDPWDLRVVGAAVVVALDEVGDEDAVERVRDGLGGLVEGGQAAVGVEVVVVVLLLLLEGMLRGRAADGVDPAGRQRER